MRNDWSRRPGVWCALGVFVLALAVYIRTLAATASFWDCGEYITVSHILGIPHQPGTPLYVMVGRCFDLLFGGLVGTARALNFMSALFGALGVMFTYLIVADIARRADADSGWLAHAGGVIGALFLLFSDTYWNNSIEAEVYGLSGFVVALLTWLGLRWYDVRQDARGNGIFYLVLYLLGLGVGFHLGAMLVYPAIFAMMYMVRDKRLSLLDLLTISCGLALFLFSTMTKNDGMLVLLLLAYTAWVAVRAWTGHRFALIGSALFALGLSVHIFMLIRAGLDPAINQTQPDNLRTLLSVLRREQYPPLDPFVRQSPLSWQIAYYYNFLIRQFTFIGDGTTALSKLSVFVGPLFLGVLGLFHGLRRARPWIWMLAVGYVINADILNLYLNFTQHEVRERDYFYSTGFLYAAMLIGLGAAALLRYAAGPEGKSARELVVGKLVEPVRAGLLPKVAAGLLILVAALPLLVPGHPKWFEHDRSRNRVPREYAWNMLAGLDRDAILFTNGDNDTFPIWYLQNVEDYRTDVTVVNLSLVNLPWYVKQIRRHDRNLPLSYTDAEIDRLEAQFYRDPKTGEQGVVYVRDYVLDNMLTANEKRPHPRPVFFAVTIPQENMAYYYPFLTMEGLTFRFGHDKRADDQPGVDAERSLQNLLGVYDYDAMLTGRSPERWSRFRAQAGLAPGAGDAPGALRLDGSLPRAAAARIDYASFVPLLGEKRRDVWRDQNTTNLLGNYPAAAVRAGYEYLIQAQAAAAADTATYDRLIDRSLAAFELARRFDPFFPTVADFYPLLLVEKGRATEGLAFLGAFITGAAQSNGRIRPQEIEEAVNKTVMALAGTGRKDEATAFLEQRIAAAPKDPLAYRLLFNMNRALNDPVAARKAYDRLRAATGQKDEAVERALQRLESGPGSAPAGAPGGAR